MTGIFDNVNKLLGTIKPTVGPPIFLFREIKSTGKNEIIFGKYDESLFLGIPGGRGVHIGYKMGAVTSNKLMKSDETKAYFGKFPDDLYAGMHLIFNYTNIFEYQYVVDAKAPL